MTVVICTPNVACRINVDSKLECFEVNFTHSLLCCERRYAVTVGFLIVQREVFKEGEYALGLHTLCNVSRGNAGKECVLGIVLEVTSREGSSVNVYAGSVESVIAHPSALFTNHRTLFFHKLFIESSGNNVGRYIVASCRTVIGFLTNESERTVGVNTFGNTERIYGNRSEFAEFNHFGHLFKSKLVKEFFPLFVFGAVLIPRVDTFEVHKADNSLFFTRQFRFGIFRHICGSYVPGFAFVVLGRVGIRQGVYVPVLSSKIVRRRYADRPILLGKGLREGAFEVVSRHFGNSSTLDTFGYVVELVVVFVCLTVDIHFICDTCGKI